MKEGAAEDETTKQLAGDLLESFYPRFVPLGLTITMTFQTESERPSHVGLCGRLDLFDSRGYCVAFLA